MYICVCVCIYIYIYIYVCVYIYCIYSWIKSVHTPCRICNMLIISPSKRDHTKCMLLFICIVFSSGASVSVWTFCNSWIWVPQLSSVWKDGSQNHTVIVGKGSNTQKCWKTKEFVGAEGFFWRTADSLTVQNKQGTHEQLSIKNTAVDHSGNNTVLRIKRM